MLFSAGIGAVTSCASTARTVTSLAFTRPPVCACAAVTATSSSSPPARIAQAFILPRRKAYASTNLQLGDGIPVRTITSRLIQVKGILQQSGGDVVFA
jgi:hypothetical protein